MTKNIMNNELRDYLADDDVMRMLKVIDEINPPDMPTEKVSTIRTVADVVQLPIKWVWGACDRGVRLGILMYYSGMLSRKKVDLTEFGERILDAEGTEELRKMIREWRE